jgi:hypothetical protein
MHQLPTPNLHLGSVTHGGQNPSNIKRTQAPAATALKRPVESVNFANLVIRAGVEISWSMAGLGIDEGLAVEVATVRHAIRRRASRADIARHIRRNSDTQLREALHPVSHYTVPQSGTRICVPPSVMGPQTHAVLQVQRAAPRHAASSLFGERLWQQIKVATTLGVFPI